MAKKISKKELKKLSKVKVEVKFNGEKTKMNGALIALLLRTAK